MHPTDPSRHDRFAAPAEPASRTIRCQLATAVVALAVCVIVLLQACSFQGHGDPLQTPSDVYDTLDMSPYVEPEDATRETVIDTDLLRAEHGFTCARAPRAASDTEIGLRIIENVKLKPHFDGTVFLNGWQLEYAGNDHHVLGLGTSIFNIVQLGDQLVWNAGGIISDHNGDDGYRWCYAYTVVSWRRPNEGPIGISPLFQTRVEMEAMVSDTHAKLMYVDGEPVPGKFLHQIAGSFTSPGNAPRARLLAGFGSIFTDDDHHILQLGFDMGKAKIKRKKIKWKSQIVVKDNAGRRFRAAEIVSVLGGKSVNVWHPSTVTLQSGDGTPGVYSNNLSLTPRSPSSCPSTALPVQKVYNYVITGVPYTWAMPMLTGWDIGDPCDDNHVKFAGAWIDSWHYDRNGGNGILTYTVATSFADQDHKPGMVDRVKVDVLGIDMLMPPGLDPRSL